MIPHYLMQLDRKNDAINYKLHGLRSQFLNMYHEDILINNTNNTNDANSSFILA